MNSPNQIPKINRIKRDQLTVSTELLGEILGTILADETKIRFRAPGNSMLPFIKNGDTLTISPVSQAKPNIGKVVAFIHPINNNLLVHRVIDKRTPQFLIKGDNSPMLNDGWIHQSQLIGCVTSIERDHQKIRFGSGLERYVIAFLSKNNMLTKITHRLRR